MRDRSLDTIPTSAAISIYVKRSEVYGIRAYSDCFARWFGERGYRTTMRGVGLLGLIAGLRKDRSEGNYSVLSLWHGLLGWINGNRVIYLLHGFPNAEDYGAIRGFLVWWISKISARGSVAVANSALTYAVSTKIFGIKCDDIWNPLRARRLERPEHQDDKAPVVLFVGRAIEGKHVLEAIEGFQHAKGTANWEFWIVGPIEDPRLEIAAKSDVRVRLWGNVAPDYVTKFMKKASIFISLNPLEPFGMVYMEAFEAGLAVVAPRHVGAFETLSARTIYPVDSLDPHSIAAALDSAIDAQGG